MHYTASKLRIIYLSNPDYHIIKLTFLLLKNTNLVRREEIEVKEVKYSSGLLFYRLGNDNCKKPILIALGRCPSQVRALPSPEVSQLISHLPQGFARAQDLSALFACTQLSCFASFIKDLPYGLLTSIPWDTGSVNTTNNKKTTDILSSELH